jgi:hypothetical protein
LVVGELCDTVSLQEANFISARTRFEVHKLNRGYIREELSKRFIPYLRSIGFEQAREPANVDGRSTQPFGIFVRRNETVSDIIDIQFDKYSKPRFTINFRKDPSEPIDKNLFGLSRANCNFIAIYRLHPRPNSAGWFTMRTFLGLRTPETGARKIVDRLMSVFPEVEGWLANGTMGKHLRMIPMPVIEGTREEAVS